MGPGLLQNVLRETVIWTLARQLQPHMGHPHRYVLVLHLLQFPQGLQWVSLDAYEVVSDCSWRCGSNFNHDCRHHCRVFLYTYHLEQHLPPHPPPALSRSHTCSHSRPNDLYSNCGKQDTQPNGTTYPWNRSVLHLCGCNSYLRHCAVWSNVRRPCCWQVKKVPRKPNVHRQLPLHDDKTAVVLLLSLVPRLWLQVHRILLVFDALLPTIHRCHGRHESFHL